MTQRNKIGNLFWTVLLVILGVMIFRLMEEQKQQTARLRALRKRLSSENGLDTDSNQLSNDWQNIRSDLHKASDKALKNVQQIA